MKKNARRIRLNRETLAQLSGSGGGPATGGTDISYLLTNCTYCTASATGSFGAPCCATQTAFPCFPDNNG